VRVLTKSSSVKEKYAVFISEWISRREAVIDPKLQQPYSSIVVAPVHIDYDNLSVEVERCYGGNSCPRHHLFTIYFEHNPNYNWPGGFRDVGLSAVWDFDTPEQALAEAGILALQMDIQVQNRIPSLEDCHVQPEQP
jgi:hypothetical protein